MLAEMRELSLDLTHYQVIDTSLSLLFRLDEILAAAHDENRKNLLA